jgi:hypothetical protein
LVLKEWKYDFHSFVNSAVYDAKFIILDEFVDKVLSKDFKGVNYITGSGMLQNTMQKIYKQRFEIIFTDQDMVEALSTQG